MLGLKAAAAAGAVLTAGLASAGGWAVVTVKDLPEYFVAGQQYRVEFQVRPHGREPLSRLEPRLIVRGSEPRRVILGERGELASIPAIASGHQGTYAATFTAPRVERVFLTIKNGFGGELRLYPQPVVAGGTTPAPLPAADRGRMLFVAKGCNTCHASADLRDRPDNRQFAVGPELSGGRLAPAYVAEKLTRPASRQMPDLGLTEAEVGALVAFLTAPGAAVPAGR